MVKVFASKKCADSRFWKRALVLAPGANVLVGVRRKNLHAEIFIIFSEFIDMSGQLAKEALCYVAFAAYLREYKLKAAKLRAIEAIAPFKEYLGFRYNDYDTWGVPFDRRLIQLSYTTETGITISEATQLDATSQRE